MCAAAMGRISCTSGPPPVCDPKPQARVMRRLFLPLQVVQLGRELWLLVPDLRVALVPFLC